MIIQIEPLKRETLKPWNNTEKQACTLVDTYIIWASLCKTDSIYLGETKQQTLDKGTQLSLSIAVFE
jgi:hypothetical protein